jgi:hypothetical protein
LVFHEDRTVAVSINFYRKVIGKLFCYKLITLFIDVNGIILYHHHLQIEGSQFLQGAFNDQSTLFSP